MSERMTATMKEQLLNNYGLVTATYDSNCARQDMSAKELALLKSLCSSNVFGLKYLCEDMDNVNTFNTSYDCKLAQSGTAQSGTLFSIWSRNNHDKHVKSIQGVTTDRRDFGVRVHIDLLNKMYNDSVFADAIRGRNAEVHNEKNGVEIRFSKFATLTDCLKFIVTMQDALDNVIDVDAEVVDIIDTLAIEQNNINVLMIEQKADADTNKSKSKSKSKKQRKQKA